MMKGKNRHTIPVVVLSMAISLLLGACSSTQTVGEEIDDSLLTSRVKTKLTADPEVNPFEIDVDTLNSVVTLRGTVETPAERTEAEELARSTNGVKAVVNEINLGDHTIREGLSDATIASKIKSKLAADPDINPFDIDVDADLGVVTLSGIVRTPAQKREAESIARDTSGVKGVNNEIQINAQGSGR